MNASLMNKNSAYWGRLAVAAVTEPDGPLSRDRISSEVRARALYEVGDVDL